MLTSISQCKIHLVHLPEVHSLYSSSIALKSKSRVSSENQGKLLAVSICKNQKQVTYIEYTVTQSKYSHSKGIERYMDKPECKPNQANIPEFLAQHVGHMTM